MILIDLTGGENHPAYQKFAIENGSRQYDFLRSAVEGALAVNRPFLSQTVLKALNFHAIACLHTSAGEFRPCPVTVGEYHPPAEFQVPGLMDDFVNQVNRHWVEQDALVLAAFVLWRLNYIHPFINGNGRTARAACLFVLCVKLGGWLPGTPILPELIRQNRGEYVEIMKAVDASAEKGALDLGALHDFLARLLEQQLASANSSDEATEDGPNDDGK
ncbi:Fic family protein [Leisingera sp. S132]|uniref:Fic family protein n=1 Tax=Leisingera sp. S132 TaxID=2867016 RepID=UPI0021A3CEFE|nr:Fic family protein [Leisingera sp. S132]UWQ78898.1 Fic family protein [Leisingera sp. S132]